MDEVLLEESRSKLPHYLRAPPAPASTWVVLKQIYDDMHQWDGQHVHQMFCYAQRASNIPGQKLQQRDSLAECKCSERKIRSPRDVQSSLMFLLNLNSGWPQGLAEQAFFVRHD